MIHSLQNNTAVVKILRFKEEYYINVKQQHIH